MNSSLRISEVIECVKKIVDSVRCTVCDRAEGDRLRYPCGHTACDECMTVAEGCMLCVTPLSTFTTPVDDEPFSRRVDNACTLLRSCQDTFNSNVYRSQRTSEQLRVEKELFPKCIQAPVKYFNKRKSFGSKNKENIARPFYPGENISQSNSFKMNKSNNYVQQWLNNSDNFPRKALGDLTINHQSYKNAKVKKSNKNSMSESIFKNEIVNCTPRKNLKRLHSNHSFSLLDTSKNTHSKKSKTDQKKNENDESGIVLDDEPILIEESQSQVLDKDALALQAVEAADKQQANFTTTDSLNITQNTLPSVSKTLNVINHDNNFRNVPFYKKGSLLGSYTTGKNNTSVININDVGKISFTIEDYNFVTTINISNVTETGNANKSVQVQTDISDTLIPNSNVIIKNTLLADANMKDVIVQSKDASTNASESESNVHKYQLVQSDKRVLQSPNIFDINDDVSKKKFIVIDDSDSDVSSSLDVSVLHVTADVHRSCEPIDYGILEEIKPSKLLSRPRKKVRGATPDSNNSSDKENCDPNKNKKGKYSNKIKCSKK